MQIRPFFHFFGRLAETSRGLYGVKEQWKGMG